MLKVSTLFWNPSLMEISVLVGGARFERVPNLKHVAVTIEIGWKHYIRRHYMSRRMCVGLAETDTRPLQSVQRPSRHRDGLAATF